VKKKKNSSRYGAKSGNVKRCFCSFGRAYQRISRETNEASSRHQHGNTFDQRLQVLVETIRLVSSLIVNTCHSFLDVKNSIKLSAPSIWPHLCRTPGSSSQSHTSHFFSSRFLLFPQRYIFTPSSPFKQIHWNGPILGWWRQWLIITDLRCVFVESFGRRPHLGSVALPGRPVVVYWAVPSVAHGYCTKLSSNKGVWVWRGTTMGILVKEINCCREGFRREFSALHRIFRSRLSLCLCCVWGWYFLSIHCK